VGCMQGSHRVPHQDDTGQPKVVDQPVQISHIIITPVCWRYSPIAQTMASLIQSDYPPSICRRSGKMIPNMCSVSYAVEQDHGPGLIAPPLQIMKPQAVCLYELVFRLLPHSGDFQRHAYRKVEKKIDFSNYYHIFSTTSAVF